MARRITYLPEYTFVGVNDGTKLIGGRFDALLVSQGHYRKPNGSWSGGGPFYVIHRSLTHRAGAMERRKVFLDTGNTYVCSAAGAVGCPAFALPSTKPSDIAADLNDLAGYALDGYNRTKPGHPEADAFVALKELFADGLPSIPFGPTMRELLRGSLRDFPRRLEEAIKDFRRYGGEYLNVQFGWVPFVRDIRKVYSLLKVIDKRVAALASQNGHTIRRRTILRATEVTTSESRTGFAYGFTYGGYAGVNRRGTSHWTKIDTVKDTIWYSARYRYWIPDVRSWQWNARARLALFGALPTPGALWDAMPWTWLTGWFTDIGAILDAVSPTAVSNLTQLYGYTMRTLDRQVTTTDLVRYPARDTVTGSLGQRWAGTDASFSSRYRDVKKMRTGGFNPFGPDTWTVGLTPYQASILAALGLSRAAKL